MMERAPSLVESKTSLCPDVGHAFAVAAWTRRGGEGWALHLFEVVTR